MRRSLLVGVVLALLIPALVYAVTQTINTVPTSNTTFLTDLQSFLRNEDANRFVQQFQPFVVQNGLHTTVAGLTGNPGDTIAYPNGFYARETATITYPDNSVCYVVMDSDVTGNLTTFTRIAGTKYLRDCSSSSPAAPMGTVYLMKVTTVSGAITDVVDLRPRTPVAVFSGGTGLAPPFAVGDLLMANSASSWGRLPDGADGNVLRASGAGIAPVYGKVRVSGSPSDITGTLPIANGGTGLSASATNGQLLIGNGVGFALGTITPGSNITVSNGPGSITINSIAPLSTGTYGSRGLSAKNNASVPNTRFDMTADVMILRSPANEIAVRHNPGVTLTNDVSLAGPAANSRDQAGAFSSSSWVYFYWICCNPGDASLSSATAPPTGPTLPTGYTYWGYVGAVRFNGSSQLLKTRILGNWAYYEARQAALADGRATSETTVSLSSLIPPGALATKFHVEGFTQANGAKFTLRYISGSDFDTHVSTGALTGVDVRYQIEIPNVSQQIFYIYSSDPSATAGLYIDVEAYKLANGGT